MGYSFGAVLAMEVVNILESLGYVGTLICIDGSPLFMKQLMLRVGLEKERDYEAALLCHILYLFMTVEEVEGNKVTKDYIFVSTVIIQTFFIFQDT